MMVATVSVLSSLRLLLTFEEGPPRTLDCLPLIHSGDSLALLDPEFFARVEVSLDGGLFWPNGFNLSPERIADLLG